MLLQPRLSLQDLLPNVDLAAAAKEERLPNLDAAYVGMVEETGSLYVLSPDRYPLVVFGDTNTFDEQHGYGAEYGVGRTAGRLIDPPPGLGLGGEHSGHADSPDDRDFAPDVDSIARFMKRKKLCREPGAAAKDKRCWTGVRRMESSRLSRLLDGAATVPLPYTPEADPDLEHPFGQSDGQTAQVGNDSLGRTDGAFGRPQLGDGTNGNDTGLAGAYGMGVYALGVVTLVLGVIIAWVIQKKGLFGQSRSTPASIGVPVTSVDSINELVKAVSSDVVMTNGVANGNGTASTSPVDTKSPSEAPISIPFPPLSTDAQTSQASEVIDPTDMANGTATPRPPGRKVSFGEALKVTLQDGDDANEGTGAEGDDSDNDAPAVAGKRKAVRRRRGKKKPKSIITNGSVGDEDSGGVAGEEKDGSRSADSAGQNGGVVHVVSPSAIVVPPPATPTPVVPSLIVSDTILGKQCQSCIQCKALIHLTSPRFWLARYRRFQGLAARPCSRREASSAGLRHTSSARGNDPPGIRRPSKRHPVLLPRSPRQLPLHRSRALPCVARRRH